ncbi:MAG TPA: NlpC/P60 family protein [Campylobacterales bacterium]|nr:NlpC/P60 family protein [Campylobacterales bacterium]
MKKTLLSTVIFISSASFFSGCANSTPNADKKLAKESLSVYNIMGIKEPKKTKPLFVVTQDTTPNYNFVIENSPIYQQNIESSPTNMQNSYISNNIEVVSYGSYNPRVETPIQEPTNRQEVINNIERDAKSFLGTKYVWGATGPSKFDCSGFTQWVYRDAGINIPRVSRDQAKVGQYVSFNNLRKGDMIFFDTKKHRKGIVTHVGIYLGNGNFIHASSSAKKVVVYNWNDKPFYKKRFLWGRRVIQDNTMYASN